MAGLSDLLAATGAGVAARHIKNAGGGGRLDQDDLNSK